MWQITFTSSFLESLNNSSDVVKKKFPYVMRSLETNPTTSNSHSIKLDNYYLWRIPVTRRYRVFYQYGGNNWVKLIEISKRNEGTYKGQRLDKLQEEEIPDTDIPDWFIDDIPPQEKYQLQRISEQELTRYDIPQIYWQHLIQISKEENEKVYQDNLIKYITDYVLEEEDQDRIFDCFITKSLEQLEHQAGYISQGIDSAEFIQEYLAGNKNFSDLILHLSPEQQKILELPLDKPILVRGGAGTGKTILAIHKTAQIAKQNRLLGTKQKILFTTYTSSLVNYVKQLLFPLLKTENIKQDFGVEVYTLDDLARKYYQSINPYVPEIIDREKSILLLHEVYSKEKISDEIKVEIENLGGTSFLLEEFIYYIEARGITKKQQYQQLRRKHLKKKLLAIIWPIYEKWKDKISFSGYITVDNLRSEAQKIITEIDFNPPYDFLIIDEAQDLSPTALNLLAQLVSSQKQVFLTADINQSLYQRSCGWDHIEASFNQYNLYRKQLNKSFRNTQQIGKGCVSIFPMNSDYIDSDQIIEFSEIKGDIPKIILTDNDKLQIDKIAEFYQYNKREFGLPTSAGVLLTPNSHYSEIIANKLKANQIEARYIKAKDINIKNKFIQVLDLHSIKGLEFPFVTIVGLNEGLFPQYPNNLLEQEKKEIIEQQRKLFYVGCSRAIFSLFVLGGKSKPSIFLQNLINNITYWNTEKI